MFALKICLPRSETQRHFKLEYKHKGNKTTKQTFFL